MKLSDPYNVSELRARTVTIAIAFSILLMILASRLWYLQIWSGETYRRFSDKNRFKIERLSAPRGQILDRNGVLLADNRPRFNLMFTRGYSSEPQAELLLLGSLLMWDSAQYEEKLKKVMSSHRYQPQLLARDISPEVLARIENASLHLSGADVEVIAARDYLYHDKFFHVIGYTGEIGEASLKNLQKRFPERNYRMGDQRGIIGIEALYEGRLRGADGRDFVVVDVKGRRVNQDDWALVSSTAREEPRAGQTLRLSLDFELQSETVDAFGEQTGAAVAISPETGEVLAYVSRPSIDPNIFTRVISNEEFRKLRDQKDDPFLDRVLAQHYPPASTFKLMMAAAALEEKLIDSHTTYFCPGHFRLGRRIWKCHHHSGHGRVNVVAALERSCDVFFYNVALSLGLDSMFSWSLKFGLGRRTFIGGEMVSERRETLPRFNSEVPGFIPFSDWIESRGQTTIEAETVNAGIGQGAYLVTIMQLARMVSIFGNGGKIIQPQLVLDAHSPDGELIDGLRPHRENQVSLSPETLAIVKKGMEEVITGSEGTARASKIDGIHYGGKTGTAQVVALEFAKSAKGTKMFEDHGLFVALAPLENPKIAVAVIVEHGGQGSRTAAPIAKRMIKNYLLRQEQARR